VVKGPPADRAFDAEGNPTRAAQGFANSKGIDVADLEVEEIDGGEYVVARVEEQGQAAWEVLSESLPGLIAGIRFNKSMRWNESGVAFSRPIRWLVALHGGMIIPFRYAGYVSGRETQGLRFEDAVSFSVESPENYLETLHSQGIILDNQAQALAAEVGGQITLDDDLLQEVTHLVEKPTAFRGEFEKAYLDSLPAEVLTSVMKKHQRYFIVEDVNGQLLPYFVGVRNGGDAHLEVVVDGNEQVIRARFDDAVFFVKKDLQRPLESFVEDLRTLTFQVKLGSFLDKTNRIVRLVSSLSKKMGLTEPEIETALRAAALSKADLATNMVVEMTSLQGVMGRYYALHSGEGHPVAEAIFEHYLPRSANDISPETKPGLVVGIADRLDSLMGLFAVGLAPTGTKDPFAQRRAALGICQNLMEWQLDFDLRWGLAEAAQLFPDKVSAEDQTACLEFIGSRLRGVLLDKGLNYDVVDAVLAEKGHNPYCAFLDTQALSEWVGNPEWEDLFPAFSRCVRITRDQDETFVVNDAHFEVESEQALFETILQAEKVLTGVKNVDTFMDAFMPMVPVINRFFDEVLVMVEDETVRQNRLALLQRVSALPAGIADLSFLEGF